MAHHNTTPPAASLEEAVTVLFCTDPAWTDQQPPQHVQYEPYEDKDEEYLYRSQAHSHIMYRPGPWRKPLVGEKGAPSRVIV